ncbi:g8283 [Coccomyxa elongata]
MKDLQAKLGPNAKVGFSQAKMQNWIRIDKSGGEQLIVREVETVEDRTQSLLKRISEGQEVDKADAEALKKRKLVKPESWKTYALKKGPKFALEKKKPATELTHEMLQKGTWRDANFKAYNFNALGQPTNGGHLHPLLKVRTQIRKAFTSMGFEEMPTNNYVESSFWNFDALFQPQQHPARDSHDTFFLTNPAATPLSKQPQDYVRRVRDIHENGGFGSIGYGSHWKESEAEKNLLRTHTTAVSSRMLYKLAQEGFRPAKYFSIDRVFRNEAIDRTHLAEFHQIEGVVCDRGLTLGDLIGTLHLFFSRLGLPKLRFKPAYNPYTEPSMEIFSYSEQLGKWVEVGNSGMFRPEMLRPMGLPEDVNVIAWGLGLERPTMILYGIDNIRDLFGHKVSLSVVKKNPICRLNL